MYSIRGTICSQSSSSCNAGLADQVWGAVNRNDVPFSSNDLGSGNKDLLFGFAPIRHTEFDALRTSVNITRDGHPLHPGDVVHRVHFEEGNLYYDVVGTGSGSLPRTNNQLGILLFRPGVYSAVREFGR
jgi:hypothetical protein